MFPGRPYGCAAGTSDGSRSVSPGLPGPRQTAVVRIQTAWLEALRTPYKIIEQRLIEQVVGGQLDTVDRTIAALAFDLGPPLPEGFQVILTNPFGVSRQFFSRLEITKTHVPFKRQIAL